MALLSYFSLPPTMPAAALPSASGHQRIPPLSEWRPYAVGWTDVAISFMEDPVRGQGKTHLRGAPVANASIECCS